MSFMNDWARWGQAPTPVLWQGVPLPDKWESYDQVRTLIPSPLNPASPLAQRAAAIFIRTGVPALMGIKPVFYPNTFCIMQAFHFARTSDLPGFVVIPEVAFLLDEWCEEDK